MTSPNRAASYQLAPGLWADWRRALWIEREQTLVVADLHLGYAWAHRDMGQLLPLGVADDTLIRLAALHESYRPRQLVLLGDIVHRALDLPALSGELERLVQTVRSWCWVRFVAGNHDRGLDQLARRLKLDLQLEKRVQVGPHLLMHGDELPVPANPVPDPLKPGGFLILGHEHPAVRLGDGLVNSAKCPCFLVGPHVLILPAFSSWAAGSTVRDGALLARLLPTQRLREAVAILGERLLPIPLPQCQRL